jgi:effector-binding domain-containing protein
MRGLGWERAGPLREIYLINPAEVAPDELLAEIQLPCRVR